MVEVPAGFPRLDKEAITGRVWSCPKENPDCTRKVPCRSCLGRRNRRKGRTKQRAAQKGLGIPMTRVSSANGQEENWRGFVRSEVKSGAQARPLATRFLSAEAQSDAATPIGDARPFVFLAMPDGWGSDGIVAFRLSRVAEVVAALYEMWVSE